VSPPSAIGLRAKGVGETRILHTNKDLTIVASLQDRAVAMDNSSYQ